ncbi:MAG: hypothetical protein GY845_24295 [Planctomycetes bacterium]|nr:hypothetical protein [Planctomycetota bacterium]
MKTTKSKHKKVKTDDTDSKTRNPGCANFDYHYESCLFRDECLVQKGQRCEYFERAVLPTITDNTEETEDKPSN